MITIGRETLRAYLHDGLPDAEAAEVEKRLRAEPQLAAMLELVRLEEDRGEHSVGAIWRRLHLSCPTRDQLGGYILQALDEELLTYITFHLGVVGCSFCSANLDDLQRQQAEAADKQKARRKRIINSGAGILSQFNKPKP